MNNTINSFQHNPYMAPESNLVESDTLSINDIKYNGKHVIVSNSNIDFPDVCIKCGKQGHKQYERTLRWINPWWYLTIFINILILLIVSLVVRKNLKATYFLCEEHQKKRTTKRILLTTSFIFIVLLSFAYLPIKNNFGDDLAIIALMSSFVLMIGWLITMLVVQGDFNIAKAKTYVAINGKKYHRFYLKGISNDFLKIINVL